MGRSGDYGPTGDYPRQGNDGRQYGQQPGVPPQFQGRGRPPVPPQPYAPQYQPHPQQYQQPQFIPQQQYAQQPRYAPQPPPQQQWQQPQQQPRKKRRVFLWVFLGIQALFLVWLIAGIAGTSHTGADAHTQAVQFCASKANWQYLYKSQADCVTHYGNVLNGASDVGKGIGVGIIVIVWVVVDFFLGLGYGIYRLASRR